MSSTREETPSSAQASLIRWETADAQATYHDGTIQLPEIGCQLPVAELYEDLPE
jgi:hypothetical protein